MEKVTFEVAALYDGGWRSEDKEELMSEYGFSEEKAEEMQTAYREKVQNHPLSADNLVDKKTVITAPGISVQVKKDFTSCVHLQNVDGHRYLMIDLDDPDIQVNGMSVEIPEIPIYHFKGMMSVSYFRLPVPQRAITKPLVWRL